MVNTYIEEFDKALEGWTDHRFISQEQFRALAMFSMYLVNLAEADGWQYCGHSFKESDYLCCLVVKAVVDDIPSVVFTSTKSYISCVLVFMRKLEGGMLEWTKDKYRT